jgi:hypothetical protein
MTPVTRDQFEMKSDIEVVHTPTGARFSTYRYDDPKNATSNLTINWGKAGDRLDSGEDYDRGEVRDMAARLLWEQANKTKRE